MVQNITATSEKGDVIHSLEQIGSEIDFNRYDEDNNDYDSEEDD